MATRFLIPIDYTDVCKDVIEVADEWGQRVGANLYFIHITTPPSYPEYHYPSIPSYYDFDHLPEMEAHHEQLKVYLQAFNIQSNYRTIHAFGTPYLKILETAKDIDANQIIMASHSHTLLGRIFLGSNTDYVSNHSECPLFIYKIEEKELSNTILIPLDYSEVNKPVIQLADEWAQKWGAKLHFVHVFSTPEAHPKQYLTGDPHAVPDDAGIDLKDYVDSLNLRSQYQYTLAFGKPYQQILDLQSELNARMIMIAAHSHTFADRLFRGSNTTYLLHHSKCSMYVYKQ